MFFHRKKFYNFLKYSFLFTLLLLFIFCSKVKEKNLNVYFINVGQGDASLIMLPNDKYILIDTGDGGNPFKEKDAGRDVIVPLLKRLGIKYLDYLILTHTHSDHIGGCIEVLNEISVGEIIINGKPATGSYYKKLLRKIKDNNIPLKKVQTGDKIIYQNSKDLEILFLHPDNVDNYDNLNNTSVVTYIKYKKISFLFMADAEADVEDIILNNYPDLKCTIIKVGHHGSDTSSSNRFVNQIKPEVAIISCALKNKFGHPAKSTLEKYQNIGSKIYKTYENGTILVATNGKSYKIIIEK